MSARHTGSVTDSALVTAIDRYLVELGAARGASEHTLRAYRGDLENFAAFAAGIGITAPERVTPRALRAWLAELDTSGLAKSSIQRRLSTSS